MCPASLICEGSALNRSVAIVSPGQEFRELNLHCMSPIIRPIGPCLSTPDYALIRRAIGCKTGGSAKTVRCERASGTAAQGIDPGKSRRACLVESTLGSEDRGWSCGHSPHDGTTDSQGAGLPLECVAGRGLSVEDEGPGLANTANLFVPFFTTKPGGSGIGLVLCRQIAEAHGGSLVLENRADHVGCVARLRLPLS